MHSRALNRITAALLAALLPLAASLAIAEESLPWSSGGDSAANPAPQGGYDPYAPNSPQPRYGTVPPANGGQGTYAANDSYRPQGGYGADDSYRPQGGGAHDGFTDPGQPVTGGTQDYGQPYTPPPSRGGSA